MIGSAFSFQDNNHLFIIEVAKGSRGNMILIIMSREGFDISFVKNDNKITSISYGLITLYYHSLFFHNFHYLFLLLCVHV